MSTLEQESSGKAWLTVNEAAHLLGVSRITIRRRIWEGDLEVVRLGSGPRAPIRIPHDVLVDYLADHITGGRQHG
jgi:excisionase family DNA binding protein